MEKIKAAENQYERFSLIKDNFNCSFYAERLSPYITSLIGCEQIDRFLMCALIDLNPKLLQYVHNWKALQKVEDRDYVINCINKHVKISRVIIMAVLNCHICETHINSWNSGEAIKNNESICCVKSLHDGSFVFVHFIENVCSVYDDRIDVGEYLWVDYDVCLVKGHWDARYLRNCNQHTYVNLTGKEKIGKITFTNISPCSA